MKRPQALGELLDRAVTEDPAVHGGCLLVQAPGLEWEGASGVADPDQGLAMQPDSQFQAASITKMMTATCLVMLAERGQVDLDARHHVVGAVDRGVGAGERRADRVGPGVVGVGRRGDLAVSHRDRLDRW